MASNTTTNDHQTHNNNNNDKKNKKKKAVTIPKEEVMEQELSSFEGIGGNSNTSDQDEYKSRADVLKRRSKRLKHLSLIYRDFYWCLIEELKTKHRDYVWNFATTPHPSSLDNLVINNNNINVNNNGNCEVHSCKKKAMALTRFCHTHILSDANQVLYKGCRYPTKSSPSGPTLCMKPIIKSAVPSLCSNHLEKAEKYLSRCLRKEGFTGSGTNKHPLKFNVVVAEFVRQIQFNRKESL